APRWHAFAALDPGDGLPRRVVEGGQGHGLQPAALEVLADADDLAIDGWRRALDGDAERMGVEGESTRKMSSAVRRRQTSESSWADSAIGPGWEARKAALTPPAETPVMIGKRSCGKCRASKRRSPTW